MPTPSQIDAIARMSTLLDPQNALTLKFTADGAIAVQSAALKGASYAISTLYNGTAVGQTLAFEFGIDVGPDVNAPRSALLIERSDDWQVPWDDEITHVLGGRSFPFGVDPAPATGVWNPKVAPQNTLKGEFAGPLTAGEPYVAQVTLKGLNSISTSTLNGDVLSKYLSLWLPAGTTGSVKLFEMSGAAIGKLLYKAEA